MLEKFLGIIPKTVDEPYNNEFINNPAINSQVLRNKMNSINEINDEELYQIVKETYGSILKDIFHRNDQQYLAVFTTPKFLTVLNQILSTLPSIDVDTRMYCNKLAYDYITYTREETYTKTLIFNLSRIVNRDVIPRLVALGLDQDLANYLALARYSSNIEKINIQRVNFIIINKNPKLMQPGMIGCIYSKLFDRLGILFETIMFDIINDEEEWVTEDILEVDAMVSLAVLEILNEQPMDVIRGVLQMYATDYAAYYNDIKKVRFSLKGLSSDFSRISEARDYLEHELKIYAP